jgi:hypothetical protein
MYRFTDWIREVKHFVAELAAEGEGVGYPGDASAGPEAVAPTSDAKRSGGKLTKEDAEKDRDKSSGKTSSNTAKDPSRTGSKRGNGSSTSEARQKATGSKRQKTGKLKK